MPFNGANCIRRSECKHALRSRDENREIRHSGLHALGVRFRRPTEDVQRRLTKRRNRCHQNPLTRLRSRSPKPAMRSVPTKANHRNLTNCSRTAFKSAWGTDELRLSTFSAAFPSEPPDGRAAHEHGEKGRRIAIRKREQDEFD